MDCSMPDFPVLHHLPEFAQAHDRWINDAIQQSHPLLFPFSSCLQSFWASRSFPVSSLFASGGQSIGVSASASVLPMNIQDWFPLGLIGLISLLSKGLSRVFFSTTVWKQQSFSAQLSLWSNSHNCAWLLEKHSFDSMDLCRQSDTLSAIMEEHSLHAQQGKGMKSSGLSKVYVIPSRTEETR